MDQKTRLRQKLRARRLEINEAERELKSFEVACQITRLAIWPSCKKIAVYWASDGEINPVHIAIEARNSDKSVYLPRIKKTVL